MTEDHWKYLIDHLPGILETAISAIFFGILMLMNRRTSKQIADVHTEVNGQSLRRDAERVAMAESTTEAVKSVAQAHADELQARDETIAILRRRLGDPETKG